MYHKIWSFVINFSVQPDIYEIKKKNSDLFVKSCQDELGKVYTK